MTNKTENINIDISTNKAIQELELLAMENETIIINKLTVFILNIAHKNYTNYNSIIIQLNGDIYKTKKTSSVLINELGKINQLTLDWYHDIADEENCPYLYGNFILAPDCSTDTRERHWIAIHHLHECISIDYSITDLKFHNFFNLRTVIPKKNILKMIKRAADLFVSIEVAHHTYLHNTDYVTQDLAFADHVLPKYLTKNYTLAEKSNPRFNFFKNISFYESDKKMNDLLNDCNVTVKEFNDLFAEYCKRY